MQRTNFLIAGFGLIFLLASVATPAFAGTKDRVEVLEKIVADLQSRANADNSMQRISQLEQQVQQLTGRVETLTHELSQANARLEAVSGVLAGDPTTAGAPGASFPSSGGPVSLTPPDPIADQITAAGEPVAASDAAAATLPTAVTLPGDPNAAFDYASSFLLQGDYGRAQVAFKKYVDAFPNGVRTADAQFRLGEIYLATGANAEAADAFIAHIRDYPNDARAAEAYLKLGTAFARLEQSNEACKVFQTMKRKFPSASPAVLQRANIEMARIQCS